jgi:hypothetical protein
MICVSTFTPFRILIVLIGMWPPPKQANAVPSESESRALMKLVERQQTVVSLIEKLQMESDAEHQQLSCKTMLLQETRNSMENLKKLGSTIQSDSIPLLDALSKELLVLEAKRDFLHPLFPETTTFLSSFSAVNDAIDLFKSTLEASLGQLQSFFTIVAQEFYSTEMLWAQTSSTIASFSEMVNTAQRDIALKQNGVFHPLRKLPEEILVQIFDHCADEEAQECLECLGGAHHNPKVPTRLAGVCRRWRCIALSHTRLWCRVLAPTTVIETSWDISRGTHSRAVEKGMNHFRHALPLCQGRNIELTIPTGVIFPRGIYITTLKVERPNLLNASEIWPPAYSSPKHLWLGQPATNGSLSREIPLSLISNTSKITSLSISLRFPSPINTVTHFVLGGKQPTLPLNALLGSLPRLVILDAKDALLTSVPLVNTAQSNVHSHLQTIGINGSGLGFLERALVEGLRLPNSQFLEIANVDWRNNYPSIFTLMSRCITDLGIFGTERMDVEALRTFVDRFPRLDTVSLHGAATEPALQALDRASSSDGHSDVKCSMPKAVRCVMICDYQGNGEAIHHRLREIRAHEAQDCESIKVIFQDCLNIHPDIRKDLCSSPAI